MVIANGYPQWEILTSPDGENWSLKRETSKFWATGLVHVAGTFYILGQTYGEPKPNLYVSTDGKTWVLRRINEADTLTGLAHGNGAFVAVASANSSPLARFGNLFRSVDGVNWERETQGETPDLASIAFGQGTFVAVGAGYRADFQDSYAAAMTSTNGSAWSIQSLGTTQRLTVVAYGNGRFVSAGVDGETESGDSSFSYVSPDGYHWTKSTNRIPGRVNDLIYGGGLFVAVTAKFGYEAPGAVFTSPDGESWAQTYTLPEPLMAAAYNGGAYVVCGSSGGVLTSTDGTHWLERNPGNTRPGDAFRLAAAGNGVFILANVWSDFGLGTRLVTSNDRGETWRETFLDSSLHGLEFGNGMFFVMTSNGVRASLDGIHWTTPDPSVPAESFRSFSPRLPRNIVFGRDSLAGVGDRGEIRQTDPFADLPARVILGATTDVLAEGQSGSFRLARLGNRAEALKVRFSVTGSAQAGVDHDLTTGFVTIPAGETTIDIPIRAMADNIVEGIETVVLRVESDSAYRVATTDSITIGMSDAGNPLDSWTRRNPFPTAMELYEVAFGNGTFLMTGREGLLGSTNGIDWAELPGPVPWPNLFRIAFGNGIFVAQGDGAIWRSTNGSSWEQFEGYSYLADLKFCEDRFVAATFNAIWTSSDGQDWRRVALNTDTSSVAYGQGQYVSLWKDGLVRSRGESGSWKAFDPLGRYLDVTFAHRIFVMVGSKGLIQTSPDGLNWTPRVSGVAVDLYRVFACGSIFVALMPPGTGILTSADGVIWKTHTNVPPIASMTSGPGGFVASTAIAGIFSSRDAENWIGRTVGSVLSLNSAAFGNGVWVAASFEAKVLRSYDGIDWREERITGATQIDSIRFWNGKFYAIEHRGNDGDAILTSANGLAWTEVYRGGASMILSDATQLLLAGSTNLVQTANGTDWTDAVGPFPESVKGYDPQAIATGNGRYLVSIGEFLLTGTNGGKWEALSNSGLLGVPYAIRYADGIFVAIDYRGIATSENGREWTYRAGGSFYGPQVAFGGGIWAVSALGNRVFISLDGFSWSGAPGIPKAAFLEGGSLAYGNGAFLSVGAGGSVVQSGPVSPQSVALRLAADSSAGVPRFRVYKPAQSAVTIESSIDLRAWSPWTNVLQSGVSLEFNGRTEASGRGRYFRAHQ